jgi:outer membrane protein assembly factor BamB
VLCSPIDESGLESNITSDFFTLDPLVPQDLIALREEFLIESVIPVIFVGGGIGHTRKREGVILEFSTVCPFIQPIALPSRGLRMKLLTRLIFAVLMLPVLGAKGSQDWMQWRGPNGNGTAAPTATPPLRWSENENVRWKVPIPGRGLSSPTVVGGLILLTSATETSRIAIAYDRSNGQKRWETVIHEGPLPEKVHRKNSAATPTVASDGTLGFVVFHHGGDVVLTALDLEGKVVWQRSTGAYECDYGFGYAPSPTIHGKIVIVSSEFTAGGYLAAFRSSDGEEVWRTDRRVKTSYSSPIVATLGGIEQLLLSGADVVSSYDPGSGRLFWQIAGSSKATCGTMVWSEDSVFASGGFPNKETLAVRVGVEPEVLWRHGDSSYEQSLLYLDGHVYAFNDGGIAICWEAETGREKWKVRLGGPVSASPTFAGGRIYAMNERGVTYVFAPDPEKFIKLAENTLGSEGFATPAFVGDRVYLRTADASAGRQEWLYCLGE